MCRLAGVDCGGGAGRDGIGSGCVGWGWGEAGWSGIDGTRIRIGCNRKARRRAAVQVRLRAMVFEVAKSETDSQSSFFSSGGIA